MNSALKSLAPAIEQWSSSDRMELAEAARMIEARRVGVYHPSDEELAAIDRGLEEADDGRFATEDRVAAVIATFREG